MRSMRFIPRRHHTLRRLVNLILNRAGYLLRLGRVPGYPAFLVVEPTNICNLKCPLCPTGQGLRSRPKGKMSLINFRKIIDEAGDYLYSLRLENWGEPLLNEDIFDIIISAKLKKISTSFNTNFSVLDKKNAERLVLSGLDHIKISLDGASQKSYAKYRVGGDFNRVINNIRLLLQVRSELNRQNPFIEIQFIVMKHNEGDLDQVKKLCFALGVDGLLIENLRLDMREELFHTDAYSIEKFKDWLPGDNKYSIFDYGHKCRKRRPRICSYLWTTAVINWDGGVAPCCSVFEKKYDFGNVFQDGLFKVWNGPEYITARKLIGRGLKNDTFVVCGNCVQFGIKA